MKMAEFTCAEDYPIYEKRGAKISVWPDQVCVRQDDEYKTVLFIVLDTTTYCKIEESYEDAVRILEQARNI